MITSIQKIDFDQSFQSVVKTAHETKKFLFHYVINGDTATLFAAKKTLFGRCKALFSPSYDVGQIASLVAEKLALEGDYHPSTVQKCIRVLSCWKQALSSSPRPWNLLERIIRWMRKNQLSEQLKKIDDALKRLIPLSKGPPDEKGAFLNEVEKDSNARAYMASSGTLEMPTAAQLAAFEQKERLGWDIREAPVVLERFFKDNPAQGGISFVVLPESLSNLKVYSQYTKTFEKILSSDNGKRYVLLFVNLQTIDLKHPQIVALLIDRKEKKKKQKQAHYFNPYDERSLPKNWQKLLSHHGYTIHRPENTIKQPFNHMGSLYAVYNSMKFFFPLIPNDNIPRTILDYLRMAMLEIPGTRTICKRESEFARARFILLGIFGRAPEYVSDHPADYLRETPQRAASLRSLIHNTRFIQEIFPNQIEQCWDSVKRIDNELLRLQPQALTHKEPNFMVPLLTTIAKRLLEGDSLPEHEIAYTINDLADLFRANKDLYQVTSADKNSTTNKVVDQLLEKRREREEDPFSQRMPPASSPTEDTKTKKQATTSTRHPGRMRGVAYPISGKG